MPKLSKKKTEAVLTEDWPVRKLTSVVDGVLAAADVTEDDPRPTQVHKIRNAADDGRISEASVKLLAENGWTELAVAG